MAQYNSYFIDGKLYVSVSTVLSVEGSNALIPWALKKFGDANNPFQAYNQYMAEVSDQGTRIHAFVENTLKGNKKEADELVSDDIYEPIKNFLDWLDNNEVEMLLSEHRCKSDKYRIAGTCDLVARINGEVYVADIKTGSVQPKAFTQMAAYQSFMLEDKVKIKGLDKAKLAVLNVHRDGGAVKFITHEDFYKGRMSIKDELGMFHALRYLWAKRNLKSTKWAPVIKNMEDLLSPLEESFKEHFDL